MVSVDGVWMRRTAPALLLLFSVSIVGLAHASLTLYAPFNMAGIRGNITFHQSSPEDDNVTISVHLSQTTPDSRTFAWSIHSFPVLYDSKSPCASSELGKMEHDLSRRHAPIQIPAPNGTNQVFVDSGVSLRGLKTIWGKALLLRSMDVSADVRACSNIVDIGEVKTAEAVFTSPVAGTVVFRQSEQGETSIFSSLFHTGEEYQPSSRHEWKILVTDILDDGSSRRSYRRCDYLQMIFDPDNVDDSGCLKTEHALCKIGDLTKKHGPVVVGATNSRYSKMHLIDTNLPLSALDGARSLYLVIYEKDSVTRMAGCARINRIKPKEVKALFSADGVRGYIRFSQRYRMDPTVVTVNLKNLRGRGAFYHVHQYPVPVRLSKDDEVCSDAEVAGHWNPFGIDPSSSPPPGTGTNDQYEIGDLSGKYGRLDDSFGGDFHFGIYADLNLPLFGTHSIVGRSVVIHRPDKSRWICATIGYPAPMRTAVATFYYPIVGQVVFRQEEDNPWGDTTVFAQLTYGDGSVNNTENHRWHVHERPPGRDFYNWTKRCESAGAPYNPYAVGLGRQYERNCHPDNPLRCVLGDLTSKYGRINVAARLGSLRNKHFYTDVLLPLSGPNSIIGHSLVIFDDHAPPHRGDRLACSHILIRHPVQSSVRSWHVGSGIASNVTGFLSFFQETAQDLTTAKVELSGLGGLASGYHVHEVWVPRDKAFPCTEDSVYGHFNPFDVAVSLGPSPGVGSWDQYEAGDLSGKFGLLDGKEEERQTFADGHLPLHGPLSIVGRSVVIHKKEKNFRWVCGTIQPEIKKELGRELVALASFDDSDSFVQGFIRLRQLEYKDDGLSDTWIEVDLRYPGMYNKNVTKGHGWAVFVNQVGHDAYEKVENVRCIAAGFKWNPYLSKADDESYKTDCGPRNPFRCEMGDLTGKHGPLEIGGHRRVFTDVNLPLVGNYSVLGRSIVIFQKDSPNKIACANIKPDVHLVSNVAVKKHPGFTSSRFMEQMREMLNTTDWLVMHDAQADRDVLEGECVQLSVHFYGSDAYRNQIEFSNLINFGSVKKQTRKGLRLVKTYYKPCRNLIELNAGSRHSHVSIPAAIVLILILTWRFSSS